jgi:hypothetical protein
MEGWGRFIQLLNQKKLQEHTAMLQPAQDFGSVFATEYHKGAVYGLTVATDLPGTIINTVKETILSRDEDENA